VCATERVFEKKNGKTERASERERESARERARARARERDTLQKTRET